MKLIYSLALLLSSVVPSDASLTDLLTSLIQRILSHFLFKSRPSFPDAIIDRSDVEFLAGDDLAGRLPTSTGSMQAQEFLIDELEEMGAVGLDATKTGRDAFKQIFPTFLDSVLVEGTNILGLIEGDGKSDEFVVLSAHYDHLGETSCSSFAGAVSTNCNGATDNAVSNAILLGIGRAITSLSLRRSVVLAFWDFEELGLIGSGHFTRNPLVPLDKIITVLNYDIQGTNLIPSFRDTTLAVGPESGGWRLGLALWHARSSSNLHVISLSLILGQGRSDHKRFTDKKVPSIFFTDSNGGCYHTTGDEVGVVDFNKLEEQARIGAQLTFDLATMHFPPRGFSEGLIPLKFSDAKTLANLMNVAYSNDISLFTTSDQAQLTVLRDDLNGIVRRGPILFLTDLLGDPENSLFASAAERIVELLRRTECSGFLDQQ